jgi:hypothetical protein
MESQLALGIIAGNGLYPFLLARAARQHGVTAINVAAFEKETRTELADHADSIEWMRVGQLSRLLRYFEKSGVRRAIMAGQIAPKNLFDLRPDFKALMLLASLKRRNAEKGIMSKPGSIWLRRTRCSLEMLNPQQMPRLQHSILGSQRRWFWSGAIGASV